MTLPPDDYAKILEAADAYRRRFQDAPPITLFTEAPGLIEVLWETVMFGTPLTEATLATRLKVKLPPKCRGSVSLPYAVRCPEWPLQTKAWTMACRWIQPPHRQSAHFSAQSARQSAPASTPPAPSLPRQPVASSHLLRRCMAG